VEYQRKLVDPSTPFQPGKTYELVLAHKSGDMARVTRAQLEQALRARYGEVRVLDWGKRGEQWVVRLTVDTPKSTKSIGTNDPWAVPPTPGYGGGCGSRYCPQPMSYGADSGLIQPAIWAVVPAVFSAAAVLAVLYLVWRIVADLKEVAELVPPPALAVGVSGAGVGMGALGVAVLGLVILSAISRLNQRRRKWPWQR
jgi:hypothetical protein